MKRTAQKVIAPYDYTLTTSAATRSEAKLYAALRFTEPKQIAQTPRNIDSVIPNLE